MNFLSTRKKAGGTAFLFFAILLLLAFAAPFFESPLVTQIFAPMCHQKAERCFHYDGFPWPICVRCVAIYFGIAMGGLWYFAGSPRGEFGWKWLGTAMGLNFLDFGFESVGVYDNLFATRIAVGLFLGLSITLFCLSRIAFTEASSNSEKSPTHE